MSLPSSEPLPEDINELPPARQRHIRRQPRTASLAERQILLDSLLQMTGPTLNFFLLSLLGAITMGIALYLDDPVILLAAVVIFPFLTPIFGIALLPTTQKWMHALKVLLSLLILLILTFASGVLFGWLQKTGSFNNLQVYRFSAPYWLDIAIIALSAILGVFIFLRQGRHPRLIGVILAYEILFPMAIAGFGFPLGIARVWPGGVLLSLTHLSIAVLMATITFLLLGFAPKRVWGWLMVFSALALTIALLIGSLFLSGFSWPLNMEPIPTPIPSLIPNNTAPPKAVLTATETQPSVTSTVTLTQTTSPSLTSSPTASITPTPEPTTYWVVVDSLSGAVIRETPDFAAPVIGYVNHYDEIEIFGETYSPGGETLWYKVRTTDGETGWLLGSLANTQTPTPTET